MGRRVKPATEQTQGQRPPARRSPKTEDAKVRDLEKRLAEAVKGKAEALEQRTATSEVLRLIAESPADLPAVLNGILGGAIRLVGAEWGAMTRFDGELFHLVAQQGATPGFLETAARLYPLGPDPDAPSTRAITERKPVYIEDAFEAAYRGTRELARAAPYRSLLSLPLLREGRGIGTINLCWPDVRPFPADRIEVLQIFADQAVIAIENVRLFTELQTSNRDLTEALDQQTATSEILRVISSSPTSVDAVFDTILTNALRLCETPTGGVFTFDGQAFHLAAAAHWSDEFLAALQEAVIVPGLETPLRRVGLSLEVSHVADIFSDPSFSPPAAYRLEGMRTSLAVPMLKESRLIGALTFHRREVRPFTEQQIALIKTFADQAVIAIENVRLFTELQEKNYALTEAHARVTQSLDRQTATSEILKVISSSPTDVQPVFATIVKSAFRLCDAVFSVGFRFDGERLHLMAQHGWGPEAIERARQIFPAPPDRTTVSGLAIISRAIVHIEDMLEDPEMESGARAGGWRCGLGVPMLREGVPIGALTVARAEPRPFSGAQVDLLKTFADQAVIAIENVRLFTETKEALERQTATGEILRVISSSPTDTQPVFEAIARSAAKLCAAKFCHVFQFDGKMLHAVAHHGLTPELFELLRARYPRPPGRGAVATRSILSGAVEQVPDVEADPEFEFGEFSQAAQQRSVLAVPMLRDGRPIGSIALARGEPGFFPERQIELLKTFADQAVIAIENVRLFNELGARNRDLTEALEQQTATSDILRVISRSPTDVQPVFDTIVSAALKLCSAHSATVLSLDGKQLRLAALAIATPEGAEAVRSLYPRAVGRDSAAGRAVLARKGVAVTDVLEDPEYTAQSARARATAGFRSVVSMPLLRDGVPIGAINVGRREPGPFPEAQISVLQTFADQAVIAIENVRLFKELESRNRDLTEALEQQTATSEILSVISRSPTD